MVIEDIHGISDPSARTTGFPGKEFVCEWKVFMRLDGGGKICLKGLTGKESPSCNTLFLIDLHRQTVAETCTGIPLLRSPSSIDIHR